MQIKECTIRKTTPDARSGESDTDLIPIAIEPNAIGAKINQTPIKTSLLGSVDASAEYFGTKLSCQTSCCNRSESGVYFGESDIVFWGVKGL